MSKRFPRTESEVAALALRVAEGLAKAAEDFPSPPIPATELKAKLDVFKVADTATVASGDLDAFDVTTPAKERPKNVDTSQRKEKATS